MFIVRMQFQGTHKNAAHAKSWQCWHAGAAMQASIIACTLLYFHDGSMNGSSIHGIFNTGNLDFFVIVRRETATVMTHQHKRLQGLTESHHSCQQTLISSQLLQARRNLSCVRAQLAALFLLLAK